MLDGSWKDIIQIGTETTTVLPWRSEALGETNSSRAPPFPAEFEISKIAGRTQPSVDSFPEVSFLGGAFLQLNRELECSAPFRVL